MADALPLPPVLAGDERFQTLGTLAARISDIDRSPVLVYLVDQVNASVLPHLAEQLHLLGEGWQFARDDDERRKLLKRAVELHRHKGTPWAIQQVLETLALSGQISEWFQYGGQPYHFKVSIDLFERGLDEAGLLSLEGLIADYKNVRSRMETLQLSLTGKCSAPVFASVSIAGEATTIYPYQATSLSLRSGLYIGIGCFSVEQVTVFPTSGVAHG